MKMYIAGPISGLDPIWVDNNFKTAARVLKILDIEPVNPNDMSGWGLSWEAYMSIAETIFKTGEIDGVLMLEGWEHSKGARLEHAWAVLDKIPIYYEKDGILEPARKLKKERAERPYDAMGDDQGRGGSAETRTQDPGDSWYRENFVGKNDDEIDAELCKLYQKNVKINYSDDAIIEDIKRAGERLSREVKK